MSTLHRVSKDSSDVFVIFTLTVHGCIKGDEECDEYFMVLYEWRKKISEILCAIFVMSPLVQGQGGWEAVQNFLTMPSRHHLMLCFHRSFCACSLPCIKINKWNIKIWIPQLPRAWRRGRVPSKALAAAVGSHWGLQRCPKAQQPVRCLQEMQCRRLLSCTGKPGAAWMWFSLGGCTTWIWQLRVASKCVLSNAAGAFYKAGRCLFSSAI